MPVKEVVLCHVTVLLLFFRCLSVFFYNRKWKCCSFRVFNAAAKDRFFYVWNESVRKRLVDDSEFYVPFYEVKVYCGMVYGQFTAAVNENIL